MVLTACSTITPPPLLALLPLLVDELEPELRKERCLCGSCANLVGEEDDACKSCVVLEVFDLQSDKG